MEMGFWVESYNFNNPYTLIFNPPRQNPALVWIYFILGGLSGVNIIGIGVPIMTRPNYPGWWFGTRFICSYIGNNNPNSLSYFSEGFKPPTSINYDLEMANRNII